MAQAFGFSAGNVHEVGAALSHPSNKIKLLGTPVSHPSDKAVSLGDAGLCELPKGRLSHARKSGLPACAVVPK
jgi:hypothetical protein